MSEDDFGFYKVAEVKAYVLSGITKWMEGGTLHLSVCERCAALVVDDALLQALHHQWHKANER